MGYDFPEDFLWGASTSAHQVEGNNTKNDWWRWERSGATEPSGIACDHYNRYAEDFRLAHRLGHNAHRFGLEWSRLQPENDTWDPKEWEHYKRVLDELLSLGMRPVVTLHHFTLPVWLSDKGGWLNDDSPRVFARFAEKAAKELGTRTTYWITINEPDILALLGYLWGEWPPCLRDRKKMLCALRNMLRAHSAAYQAIKKHSSARTRVGLAKAVTAFHPCSRRSSGDRMSAYIRSRCHN
ncbi:MAG: family 1 glycosylhydrolase, partial [Candidatus Omnitrophica bacterium]|nr:family 1 glycosylhydrolase [Candidatus Omnitrophota bacterium]